MRVDSAADVPAGTKAFFPVPVGTTVSGAIMQQTFHVVRGRRDGPMAVQAVICCGAARRMEGW